MKCRRNSQSGNAVLTLRPLPIVQMKEKERRSNDSSKWISRDRVLKTKELNKYIRCNGSLYQTWMESFDHGPWFARSESGRHIYLKASTAKHLEIKAWRSKSFESSDKTNPTQAQRSNDKNSTVKLSLYIVPKELVELHFLQATHPADNEGLARQGVPLRCSWSSPLFRTCFRRFAAWVSFVSEKLLRSVARKSR